MAKLILCRGIQASGKSTFSKAWVLEDPKTRVRFSYDDLRRMMGQYWVPSREPLVLAMRDNFMRSAMSRGYDIIVDNMNLNPEEHKYYEDLLIDFPEYTLENKDFFDVSLKECIKRDKGRPEPIGAAIITATYKKYKDIIEG